MLARPMPRRTTPLALVALALLALACRRSGDDTHAPQPDATGERTIAHVGEDGRLEPDPEQVAAGIPYLRFAIDLSGSPSRGPADAPVTIVMFSDFECPYCAESMQTIAALERQYEGKLRFVYKALPLMTHPSAMLAALVGHSAWQQGKFWPYHDRLFSGGELDEQTIVEYAREAGLDLPRVAREVEDLTYGAQIRRDLRAAKRLQLRSTPIFFINGRMLPGARAKHVFRQVIDQELALAEQLREQGVATADLYARITQWGYTAIVYENDEPELDEDTVYPVPIGDAPTRGPADAPITIVAFSDFQCPFCAKGDATMRELAARYGDQIRFVFKHFPLPGHPRGALASRASFVAMQAGKFWEFHDAVFDLDSSFTPDDLLELGASLGLDRGALEQAMSGETHDDVIEADIALGMRLGVTGTPAYFVNGRPIVGAHPEIDFRLLIAEELERVAAVRAKGVAAGDVYRELTGAP